MRYHQGHAVSTRWRVDRRTAAVPRRVRLKAAERFAEGEASSVIARDLRVSVRSVQRWRQMWDEGGPQALRSQGPASLPRLSEKRFAQLEAELAKGRPRTAALAVMRQRAARPVRDRSGLPCS
ncbi:helix-turn-helix domain-containing protein [Streptomyces collinus]